VFKIEPGKLFITRYERAMQLIFEENGIVTKTEAVVVELGTTIMAVTKPFLRQWPDKKQPDLWVCKFLVVDKVLEIARLGPNSETEYINIVEDFIAPLSFDGGSYV